MVPISSFRNSIATSSVVLLGSSTNPNDLLPHWELYPKSYGVSKLPPSSRSTITSSGNHDDPTPAFAIDGNIDKDIWMAVPWSDEFGDIQGPLDGPTLNISIPKTRFKALYDDSFLYIAGVLHPAAGIATQAHCVERNCPIYQFDSDFEVFIDVDHSNHMYKELEVNAINTIWNLLLDKPYEDGGQEHSGRIARPGESNYYEVFHQATATKVVQGRINDPDNCTGALWTVEMALSFPDLLSNTTITNNDSEKKYSPTGRFWRINFSRVERSGIINWTWQPQVRWNPAIGRYGGFIQMHMPDSWGYLYFEDPADSSQVDTVTSLVSTPPERHIWKDPLWPAKLTAMTLYYALHHYKDSHAKFTDNLMDLILPAEIIAPFHVDIQLCTRSLDGGEGFVVTISNSSSSNSNMDDTQIQVYDDRLLKVVYLGSFSEKS